MEAEPLSECDSSSIVTDEPFRYACEECGSVSVRRIRSNIHEPGKTFTSGGVGTVEAEQSRAENYRCKACSHRSKAVYDKKLDACVAP